MTTRRAVLRTAATLPLAIVLAKSIPILAHAAAQSTQITSRRIGNGFVTDC
jgi:hypothetical protein